MHLKDFEQIKDKINTQYLFGSDSSLANLYLLKDVLNILCYQKNDILFRQYDFTDNIKGFAFPISLNPDFTIEEVFEQFFKEINKNSDENVHFCYFTEEQKALFDKFLQKV